MDAFVTPDVTEVDRRSRRFTQVFLIVLLGGLATTAAIAVLVDPFRVFGTGRIPTEVVNERVIKPELFLAASPPPQAIILGSSRVYKLDPRCVTELTGLPAFNFGVGNGNAEDWHAIMGFVHDSARAPLRELMIGIDVDAFDSHSDHRLEIAPLLGKYIGHGRLSWGEATRVLFGQDALQYGLRSIWFYLRPRDRGHPSYFGPDGLQFEPERDDQIRLGTYSFEAATAKQAKRIERLAADGFDRLSASRVALFQAVVRAARASGAEIDVFVAPLSPVLANARSFSQIPQREAELDVLLSQLEREGTLRYHRLAEVEDLGRDPVGFYDGAHMTGSTATRVLLRLFHRQHGCGL
jgi:hypothetical protein